MDGAPVEMVKGLVPTGGCCAANAEMPSSRRSCRSAAINLLAAQNLGSGFRLVRLNLQNSAGCSSPLISRDCAEWAPHGSDSERLGRSLAAGASRDHPKVGLNSLGASTQRRLQGGAVAVHRRATVYAEGGAAAPFGSAGFCLQEAAVEALPVVDGVRERGARGCVTPLAPARGPRCKTRFDLTWHTC